MNPLVIALSLVGLLAALPASAQGNQARPIEAPADAPFAHASSGLSLPARLDGMPRARVMEFEAPQLDIFADYRRGDGDSELTVYVYHVTSGSVPVWFDRATSSIEERKVFGTAIRLDKPLPFAPAGRDAADSMLAAWMLSGSDYRATALAIIPVGQWLVKLRYSSKTLDADALHARLRGAVDDLQLPVKAGPAAAPVTACADRLTTDGPAKATKPNSTDALLGALIGSAGASKQAAATPVSAIWCRDATVVSMGAVYRPNGARGSYLLALSDAGRGIWVTSGLAGLLGTKDKPSYSVSLALPGRTLAYAARDRLPPPAQIMDIVREKPTSVVQTLGQRKVTINADAMK